MSTVSALLSAPVTAAPAVVRAARPTTAARAMVSSTPSSSIRLPARSAVRRQQGRGRAGVVVRAESEGLNRDNPDLEERFATVGQGTAQYITRARSFSQALSLRSQSSPRVVMC